MFKEKFGKAMKGMKLVPHGNIDYNKEDVDYKKEEMKYPKSTDF